MSGCNLGLYTHPQVPDGQPVAGAANIRQPLTALTARATWHVHAQPPRCLRRHFACKPSQQRATRGIAAPQYGHGSAQGRLTPRLGATDRSASTAPATTDTTADEQRPPDPSASHRATPTAILASAAPSASHGGVEAAAGAGGNCSGHGIGDGSSSQGAAADQSAAALRAVVSEPAAASPPDGGLNTAGSSSRLQNAINIATFALPLATQNVLGYSLNALSESLVGRLGPSCLSASTLANSTYSLLGLSLVWGGAAGMETLCGQAYGAGNRRLMLLVLLRAVLVCWAVCVPVVALWSGAGPLLLALGQSPALVAQSAEYLKALAPAMFFYVLTECLQTYLVVQGRTRPTTAAKAVVTALGPLYYYGCMFGLNQGLVGAGYAYGLVKATNAALLIAYLAWSELRGQGQGQGQGSAQEPQAAAAEDPAAPEASTLGPGGGQGGYGNGGGNGNGNGNGGGSASSTVRLQDLVDFRRGAGGGGGGGKGARRGYPATPNAHEEILTPPLAAAASAHEFSVGAPAAAAAAAARSASRGGSVGGGSSGISVSYLSGGGVGRSPAYGGGLNAAVAPAAATAAATAAAGTLYGRVAAAAASLRATAAEVLDPRACWEYVKFGMPAAVMSCLEWWAYEALVIMAGWLPNAEVALGCLGICLTVGGWMYMVPQAISQAACARVANALGAGDAEGAKRNFQSAVLLVLASQVALGCLLAPNAARVAAAFCPDPAAAALAATMLPITAVNTIADGLNCVLNGTMRAAGRQALGARLHLLGYWCCGLPAAYVAAFVLGLGVRGCVLAVGATSFCQSLVVAGIISRWDWHAEVRNSATLLSSISSASSVSSLDSVDM